MTQQSEHITWWKGAVIYQIYPRSFQDTNSDGIGDLKGILQRLPYIASLGVDGIWISPFYMSPMKDFGYDVSDYRAVHPMFGTLDDFKAVLNKAHDLGLKVIIDQVLSHTSDQHPWFLESMKSRDNDKSDWYVWVDAKPDGSPPNNWLGVFGGVAWEFESRRGQYYLHNFLVSQPDLNVHNPEVQDALLDVLRFWLDMGVDGFRLDVINMCMHDPELRDNPVRSGGLENVGGDKDHPIHTYDMQQHTYDKSRPENLDFIRRIRAVCDEYDDIMTMGEIFDDYAARLAGEYTSGDDLLHTAYNFHLSGKNYGPEFIKTAFAEFESESNNAWPSWALTNHDWMRVASRWAIDGEHSINQAKMLFALLCSLRGTICIYQGEELGLPEANVPYERLQDPFGLKLWPEFKGRDGCRTPMPWDSDAPYLGFSDHETWLPVEAAHKPLAVSGQEADKDSMLNFARRCLKLRKEMPELIHADIEFKDAPENILYFERDRAFCVFNLSNQPIDTKVSINHNGSFDLGMSQDDNKIVHLAPFGFGIFYT